MEDSELEAVGAISHRQTTGLALALPRREPPLSVAQIEQVGELMANMMAAYPHQALEMAAEMFQLAFEDLARTHGIQALETALRWFLTRQKFFPHPSEVSEVLEAMAKQKKKEMAKALPPLGCLQCLDGEGVGLKGYVIEQPPGRPRFVKACECRLARERAKKAQEVKA